jgi:hypothetical protein
LMLNHFKAGLRRLTYFNSPLCRATSIRDKPEYAGWYSSHIPLHIYFSNCIWY